MTWLPLTDLLLETHPERQVALEPALHHPELRERALRLAAALQGHGVKRVALYLEDAGELAIALLGAWRAGVKVLLPADAQAQTRQRLAAQVDLWLDDLAGLDAEASSRGRVVVSVCSTSALSMWAGSIDGLPAVCAAVTAPERASCAFVVS